MSYLIYLKRQNAPKKSYIAKTKWHVVIMIASFSLFTLPIVQLYIQLHRRRLSTHLRVLLWDGSTHWWYFIRIPSRNIASAIRLFIPSLPKEIQKCKNPIIHKIQLLKILVFYFWHSSQTWKIRRLFPHTHSFPSILLQPSKQGWNFIPISQISKSNSMLIDNRKRRGIFF